MATPTEGDRRAGLHRPVATRSLVHASGIALSPAPAPHVRSRPEFIPTTNGTPAVGDDISPSEPRGSSVAKAAIHGRAGSSEAECTRAALERTALGVADPRPAGNVVPRSMASTGVSNGHVDLAHRRSCRRAGPCAGLAAAFSATAPSACQGPCWVGTATASAASCPRSGGGTGPARRLPSGRRFLCCPSSGPSSRWPPRRVPYPGDAQRPGSERAPGSPSTLGEAEMTANLLYDAKILTGYPLEVLAAAFDRVRDSRDWMAPIQAVIAVEERPLVEKAVLWFTDTIPEFAAEQPDSGRLVVRAPGYRLGGTDQRAGHLRPPEVVGRSGAVGGGAGRPAQRPAAWNGGGENEVALEA